MSAPPPPELGFLFDPANSVAVSAWSLIVGLVGFSITIWQIVRTRSRIETANVATEEMRLRLARQSAGLHAVDALGRVKAAQRELGAKEWRAALIALEELRGLLLLLYRRDDHIGEEAKRELPEILRDLLDFIEWLEKLSGAAGLPETKRTQIMRRLRDVSTMLTAVSDDLTERVR